MCVSTDIDIPHHVDTQTRIHNRIHPTTHLPRVPDEKLRDEQGNEGRELPGDVHKAEDADDALF